MCQGRYAWPWREAQVGQVIEEGEIGLGVKSVRAAPEDVVSPKGIGFDPESTGDGGKGLVDFLLVLFFPFRHRILDTVLAAQICTFKTLENIRWGMD